jgi:hypothetical protein
MSRTLILAISAALAAPAAHAAYRCKDEKGVTHIGDTPPAACANVPMQEVSRSGTVLRTIEPTLTPEQLKAKQDDAARKLEADKAAAEQRRKDIALLATYSSEKDIDTTREMNLKPIEGRIKSAKDRLAAVEKREKELETEMEFYKEGKGKATTRTRTAPAQLTADLEHIRSEKAALGRNIAGFEKEMQQVRERSDADKKRWLELRTLKAEGKLDLRDPREIEASKKVDASKQQPQTKRYNIYIVPAR